MNRPFMVGALTVFLVLTVAGAIRVDAVENESGKNISMDQAYNLAFASNSVVEVAVYDVQKARVKLKWADDTADAIDLDKVNTYEKNKAKILGPVQAESELFVAGEKLKQIQAQFKIQVTQAYYELLKVRKALESAKANSDRADELLEIIKTKYTAGSVAKNELLEAEVQAGNTNSALVNAENNEEIALMELNQILNLDLNTELILAEQLTYIAPIDINLEEAISKAMDKRVDILQARENINVKRVEIQVAAGYYGPYEDARYSLLQAESVLRDKSKSAEVSIKTAHLKILSFKEQYRLAETTLKQAKEALLITQKRFEAGLAKSTEVTSASADLSQAESKLADVLVQYNLAKLQFDFELGNY